MATLIRSRAPLRLSFSGGGTDVSPYVEEVGGAVLSCTIDKFAYATLAPAPHKEVRIQSLDFDTVVRYQLDEELRYDGRMDLVKAVLKRFGSSAGIDIFLHTDAPPGSGLGASSTVVVTLLGALKDWLRRPMDNYEIADLAYQIERQELQIQGGRQDQYSATFGGFNFIEFHRDSTVVNPLRIRPKTLHELEYHLMLCYTGRTRLSAHLIETQVERYRQRQPDALEGLHSLKRITYEMKDKLLQDKLYDFAELLDAAAQAKKKMNPGVTDEHIEEFYRVARQHGAIGGKILGAGGGGYLLLFCQFHRKHIVAEQLQRLGGQIVDFRFEQGGLQTWRINDAKYSFSVDV